MLQTGGDGPIGEDFTRLLKRLFKEPRLLIETLEPDNDSAVLVPFAAEDYKNLSWHTVHYLKNSDPDRPTYRVSLSGLLKFAEILPKPQAQASFLFYLPFSCSTWLSRIFSDLGCHSLREPHAFQELLTLRRRIEIGDPKMNTDLWNQLFHLAMLLLCRTEKPGQGVHMKPNDSAVSLAGAMLDYLPSSKALFLYSDFRSFFGQTWKSAKRRAYLREQIVGVWPDRFGPATIYAKPIDELSDAEVTAAYWIILNRWYSEFSGKSEYQGRIASFDCDELLRSPAESLEKICDLYGLDVGRREIDKVLALESSNTSAKDRARKYGREARLAEISEILKLYPRELAEAEKWLSIH